MVKTGKELKLMQHIGAAFGSAADPKKMLDSVMDIIWNDIEVDYGCMLLKENGLEKLHAVSERFVDSDHSFMVDGRIVDHQNLCHL